MFDKNNLIPSDKYLKVIKIIFKKIRGLAITYFPYLKVSSANKSFTAEFGMGSGTIFYFIVTKLKLSYHRFFTKRFFLYFYEKKIYKNHLY